MSQETFELACDRLSQVVDGPQFERLRWARVEGPMLARLAALAQSSLEGRTEFELCDEGSTRDAKRFVLKVHGKRIVAITLLLEGDQAKIRADEIDRSPYRLLDGPPLAAAFDAVDEQWMASTLQELFSRLQAQQPS